MTSLRKRVSSYFRQLSFHNEPRERKPNINENSFVTKYLMGQIQLKDGPPVLYGKSPNDLPNFELDSYTTGSHSIVGCSTGPNGGLTTVKRVEKHLSVTDPDIDFIDTQEEIAETKRKSPLGKRRPLDNTTMVIRVAGQEYRVTNRKSRSLGSLTDLTSVDDGEPTANRRASNDTPPPDNNNEVSQQCRNRSTAADSGAGASGSRGGAKAGGGEATNAAGQGDSVNRNFSLSKSQSECNPFEHRKRGKITRLAERPAAQAQGDPGEYSSAANRRNGEESALPKPWNRRTELVYGLSDSLYDANQVTKSKNGNPIADCYGIIARADSAILALADGVNWGDKACVAAKSAVHGCLHYLNKTLFDDTSLFDLDTPSRHEHSAFQASQNSPINTAYISPPRRDKPGAKSVPAADNADNRIGNTTEVFVSILRAFNCAHNLILENQGMLTTLTVAVVLPLKPSNCRRPRRRSAQQQQQGVQRRAGDAVNFPRNYSRRPPAAQQACADSSNTESSDSGDELRCEKYVCCVCNVGDTLAYVYSPKHGLRELTKGSHDVYCNRDMRDALGALGPVDGINPELNNLTLSVTTLDAADIVLVASDGLTDNYDPTVCKFTVNSVASEGSRPHRASHGVQASRDKPVLRPNPAPPRHPRERRSSTSSRAKDTTASKMNPSNVSRLAKESQASAAASTSGSRVNKENKPSDSGPDKLEYEACRNPLVAQFIADHGVAHAATEAPRQAAASQPAKRVSVDDVLSENRRNKGFNPLTKSSSVSGVFKSRTAANASEASGSKYGFLRSKTSVDLRPPQKTVHRNEDGLPYVTPIQKYELTLLLMEDILKRGISGKEKQCSTARTLCENLLRYTFSITAAKRHTLEDVDLYFDNKDDILVEVSQKEKKMRRKRCLEKVQNLPGKLDHVSVVACNVGNKTLELN